MARKGCGYSMLLGVVLHSETEWDHIENFGNILIPLGNFLVPWVLILWKDFWNLISWSIFEVYLLVEIIGY